MITHIVLFKWKPGVTDEQVDVFHRELARMTARVESIVAISHGPDLAFRDGNSDYGIVETFADREGWDFYQDHPLHKDFIAEYVAPIMDSRITMQF